MPIWPRAGIRIIFGTEQKEEKNKLGEGPCPPAPSLAHAATAAQSYSPFIISSEQQMGSRKVRTRYKL